MKVALLTASVVALLLFCLLPIRYIYTAPHPFVCRSTECPMDLIGKDGRSVIPVISTAPVVVAWYKITFEQYNGYPQLWAQHPIHDYMFVALVAWLLAYEVIDKYNANQQHNRKSSPTKT